MIDFHTHILQGIDDGSPDIGTSIKMLEEEHAQGVERVILTPHFYALKMGIDNFLKIRNEKYIELKESMPARSDLPKVTIGAEVQYFEGISVCEDLHKLAISGTNCVLIEMPYANWDKNTVYEVLQIGENLNLSVIIAHVNRYLSFPKNAKWIKLMASHGLCMQLNSEYALNRNGKDRIYKMLKRKEITFIGSDCHSLKSREPNLIKLKEYIIEHFGEEYFKEIDLNQKRIFSD